jgi:hypothetical protein
VPWIPSVSPQPTASPVAMAEAVTVESPVPALPSDTAPSFDVLSSAVPLSGVEPPAAPPSATVRPESEHHYAAFGPAEPREPSERGILVPVARQQRRGEARPGGSGMGGDSDAAAGAGFDVYGLEPVGPHPDVGAAPR